MTAETIGLTAFIVFVVVSIALILMIPFGFILVPKIENWWEKREKKKHARRKAARRTATRRTAAARH